MDAGLPLSVDVFPVSDFDDPDDQIEISDRANDAVRPLPDAVSVVPTRQFLEDPKTGT